MLEFSVLLQVALSGPHGLGDEATFVWQKKKKKKSLLQTYGGKLMHVS